jgi:RND family efflux transporter MFP subunit
MEASVSRIVLPLALAALALAGCGREKAQAAKPQPPAVEAVRILQPGGSGPLTATGPLERRREMTLSFRIPGVMTSLAVDEGDAVRAGQVLATVDPTGVAAAETRAAVEVDRAQRELARNRALFDKGFVAKARLEDAESALKAAQAQAQAAAFDRRWARLVSPASGVVLARLAQAGEVVQPGQAVLRIADEASPLTLRAPLSDRDVARVRVGQAATVRVDGVPQPLSGRVTRVGQRAAAQTGAVDAEIEIAGGQGLRSGQVATAEIAAAPAPSSGLTRVPAEAILEASGARAFVLVVEAGKAKRRQVTFGGFEGDDALVGGLGPDVQVITAGGGFVSDGEPVRVVDRAKLAGAR